MSKKKIQKNKFQGIISAVKENEAQFGSWSDGVAPGIGGTRQVLSDLRHTYCKGRGMIVTVH